MLITQLDRIVRILDELQLDESLSEQGWTPSNVIGLRELLVRIRKVVATGESLQHWGPDLGIGRYITEFHDPHRDDWLQTDVHDTVRRELIRYLELMSARDNDQIE